ncbi:adenylate kinase [Chitinophaga sp. SYP-B3965]|uniref:adenylate kinase n=1 Tax=Chitinophaga sp. SYP-B3965 TaxID=2663120 RepID=UPI0012997C32|nr:adenylate kinase [Chitinophaga sp. SYP-B3965]MRG48739.1 adenylate kinase [Chitinophaga sp. SYP-B3965]
MKILIFGASGAGSTTQGKDLSAVLNIPYFDTDHYFWEVQFTEKRDPAIRNKMLKADLAKQESFIVGGSLVSWGDEWTSIFDFAVFLYLPPAIRLERLKKRELERYGDSIHTDPERKKLHEEFMDWAASYDTDTPRRSLAVHEAWMKKLTCPILAIKEDLSVAERREKIQVLIR